MAPPLLPDPGISAIASAVEEQGVSTLEIARNVQHAARGTQVDRFLGEVRAA